MRHSSSHLLSRLDETTPSGVIPTAWQPTTWTAEIRMDLGNLFWARCEADPSSIALWHSSGGVTYQEMGARVEQLCREMAARAQPGDLLGSAGSGTEYSVAYLAAACGGHAFDSVDPTAGAPSLAASTLVWTGEELVRRRPPHDVSGMGLPAGFTTVVATSGTAGAPKRIVFDEHSLLWGLWNTTSIAREAGLAAGETIAPLGIREVTQSLSRESASGLRFSTGLPLRSVAGVTLMNRAFFAGDSLAIPDSLEPSDVWRCLTTSGATSVGLPPQTARWVLRLASASSERTNLLQVGIGGGPVPPAVASTLESVLGVPVVASYGATELGGVALAGRPWDAPELRWTTVGRPIGAVEAELKYDRSLAAGVLHVRSPAGMSGLLLPDLGYSPVTHDWVNTGDLASYDPESGCYSIVGRADFVIQRGGRRIDPSTVESFLEALEGVKRAAVAGRPSRIAGEQDLVALVEGDVSVRMLKTQCVQGLESHLVPRRIHLVNELPLAADGNVARLEVSSIVDELESE